MLVARGAVNGRVAGDVYLRWIKGSIGFEAHFNYISTQRLLLYFFPIGEIDSWHITRVLSCISTFLLYLYADRIRLRAKNGEKVSNERCHLVLTAGKRIRASFTLWTIGCGLYIVYSSVDWAALPPVKWLPF